MIGIKIGGLEFCKHKLVSARHVQGQIAVAIEIAMEEPALPVSMNRIIGGIQIQNDFFGHLSGGLDKGVDKELIDCFFRVIYLFDNMKTLRSRSGIGYDIPEDNKPQRGGAAVWSISHLIRISDTPWLR